MPTFVASAFTSNEILVHTVLRTIVSPVALAGDLHQLAIAGGNAPGRRDGFKGE